MHASTRLLKLKQTMSPGAGELLPKRMDDFHRGRGGGGGESGETPPNPYLGTPYIPSTPRLGSQGWSPRCISFVVVYCVKGYWGFL